jgi:hypothetical protein
MVPERILMHRVLPVVAVVACLTLLLAVPARADDVNAAAGVQTPPPSGTIYAPSSVPPSSTLRSSTYVNSYPTTTYPTVTYPAGTAYPAGYSTGYVYPTGYAHPAGYYAQPYGYSSYNAWYCHCRSGLFGRGGFLGTGLFR